VFANPGGYPHAVAFRPGEILIAYTEGLYSAPYEPGRAPLRRGEQRLLAALPAGGGGHRSRTVRVGPDAQIYVSLVENGEPRAVDDLMTGFQREDGSRWARPVGVAVGPDGALYFTSDAGANALFRLSPGNDQPRG
jgi:glucose/arabinose dehydrogenase